MTISTVITLIGDDRPGIVEAVSKVVVKHQGDWIESQMANLAGKFAGILRVKLPAAEFDTFADELRSGVKDLQVFVEQVLAEEDTDRGQCYRLQLVGQNHPGIVHRIAAAIAEHGATVDSMESEVSDASMSGEELFKASIVLCQPAGQDVEELGEVLEELANELIVDIELG